MILNRKYLNLLNFSLLIKIKILFSLKTSKIESSKVLKSLSKTSELTLIKTTSKSPKSYQIH